MNMFAQLYTLLLVVITTAAISIPQMESHNPTLKRRDLEISQCKVLDFSVFQTSFCKTMTTITAVCASEIIPDLAVTSDVDCPRHTTCIDFTTRDSIPYALCVINKDIRRWNNGHEKTKVCSKHFTMNITEDTITIGMMTYNINGIPKQVNYMNANIDDNNVGDVYSAHNFSMIYNNYKPGQLISMCFQTGFDQKVIGVTHVINGSF